MAKIGCNGRCYRTTWKIMSVRIGLGVGRAAAHVARLRSERVGRDDRRRDEVGADVQAERASAATAQRTSLRIVYRSVTRDDVRRCSSTRPRKWGVRIVSATKRSKAGAETPMRLSRDLLIRGIIYQLQERAYGGLSVATARKLEQAAAGPPSRGAAKPTQPISLRYAPSSVIRRFCCVKPDPGRNGRQHCIFRMQPNSRQFEIREYAVSSQRFERLIYVAFKSSRLSTGSNRPSNGCAVQIANRRLLHRRQAA
jgi:hypothetical protein